MPECGGGDSGGGLDPCPHVKEPSYYTLVAASAAAQRRVHRRGSTCRPLRESFCAVSKLAHRAAAVLPEPFALEALCVLVLELADGSSGWQACLFDALSVLLL